MSIHDRNGITEHIPEHTRPLGVPGPHAPETAVSRTVTASDESEGLLIALCRNTPKDPGGKYHCGRVVRVHLVSALPDGRRELVAETMCPACFRAMGVA